MKILPVVFLGLTQLQAFGSFDEMASAGHYFSPGFDCQLEVSRSEVLFTATTSHDDRGWAVFVMEKVPVSQSQSGYIVRQLAAKQVEGETISCRKVGELYEVHRVYEGDPETPDDLTLVFRRLGGGKLGIAGCAWSFGPAESFSNGAETFLRVRLKDGAAAVVPGTSAQCYLPPGE